VFDASSDPSAAAVPATDPTIEVCERHLRLLAEVAEVAVEAAKSLGRSAVAAAREVEDVLGKDTWHSETARARALAGSKDAADAFAKASRALRLTLALEKATAETLRDLRAGVLPERKAVAAPAAESRKSAAAPAAGAASVDLLQEKVRDAVTDAIVAACEARAAHELAEDLNERLTECDRFGPLLRRPLREVVEQICADIGMGPEWIRLMDDDPAPFTPRPPPEWTITRSPDTPGLLCVRRQPKPPPNHPRLE
jgi:hypothetical protein